jgi:hypothetical protein
VPFERYIVNVVRKAAGRLDEDPDIAAEADAFLRQEAQHASAHCKHMLALVQRYPELERCYEDACSAYDTLIEEQPIEFHAASTPTRGTASNSRGTFRHVCAMAEKVTNTFDEVVPFEDRGGSAREVLSNLLYEEFKYRTPGGRRRRARDGPPTLFHAVPTSQLAKMVWRLWLSQTPYHDPTDQPLPDWADTWMGEYDRGTDMTSFNGSSGES